nr:udp-glycosyltransferase 73e1 [Quercus suber]
MGNCLVPIGIRPVHVGQPVMYNSSSSAEQFYNEKLLVEVFRIGVSVGVKTSADYGEEKDKVLVRSEDVKKVIEQLMDKGEEAEERRKRARKLGEIAKKSV